MTEAEVLTPACVPPLGISAAKKGRVLLLATGRDLRKGLVASLESMLPAGAAIEVRSGANLIPATLAIEDKIPDETLRWIAAAELYEDLVASNKKGDKIGLIICLDPWAACLLSPAQSPCPDATWIFVSEVRARMRGDRREYWEEMDAWTRRLPFAQILEADAIEKAAVPAQAAVGFDASNRAAFRSVFGEPDEKLVLAIAEADDREAAGVVARAARELKGTRWVFFPATRRCEGITVLAPEQAPLLPAISSVAHSVLLFDGALPPKGCDQSRILRYETYQELMAALGGETRVGPTVPTKDYVLFNDWGIGDELLLSAVAREIVKAHPSVRVWIRSRYGFPFPDYARGERRPPFQAKWVETIYQNPVLYGPEHHSPYPGQLVQQMLDKVCLDTGLRVQATDVRPELILPATTAPAQHAASVIVHAKPNPRLPSKDWGLERWKELCKLLHAGGARVRQVGEAGDPILPHAEDLRGIPVHELPLIVSQADAVVCLVGFLMHLAEAVRTPAVVIYGGREHPAIDGYPDQIHLSSGPLPCRGRWGCHLAPDLTCPHGMKCMEKITPELVARKTLEVLRKAEKAGVP